MSPLSDEGGAGQGVVLVFQDVTEERTAEDYARHLGRILGRALNEIYFLDPKTLRFTLTNEGAQRKLGYTARQLSQMVLPDVLAGISAGDLHALFAPLVSGGQDEIVFETMIQAAEGRHYPAEICMQYFGEETPPILVAIVHDTSDRQSLSRTALTKTDRHSTLPIRHAGLVPASTGQLSLALKLLVPRQLHNGPRHKAGVTVENPGTMKLETKILALAVARRSPEARHRLFEHFDQALRFRRRLLPALFGMRQPALMRVRAHLAEQPDPVAMSPHRDPQCAFEFVGLRGGKTERREGMSDLATEMHLVAGVDMVEHPAAIGA
jgi:hypothetical protein